MNVRERRADVTAKMLPSLAVVPLPPESSGHVIADLLFRHFALHEFKYSKAAFIGAQGASELGPRMNIIRANERQREEQSKDKIQCDIIKAEETDGENVIKHRKSDSQCFHLFANGIETHSPFMRSQRRQTKRGRETERENKVAKMLAIFLFNGTLLVFEISERKMLVLCILSSCLRVFAAFTLLCAPLLRHEL